jgi:ABC-type Zn uptake system ZnuABC Zn-binding protein ZnuA
MSRRLAALACIGLIILAGCRATGAPDTAGVSVVTSTTVLADLVRQVGGERIEVRSLVPAGGEVHTFDPRPSDVTALAAAELVIFNGLGLDDWVHNLAGEAGSEAPVIALAEDLEGVEYIKGGREEHEEHEGEAGQGEQHEEGLNPHLWLDPDYAELYIARIADALASVDPDGVQAYADSAAGYALELRELDRSIADQMATVPEERRRVVTVHAAFDYFARAYGLEVVGSIIEAPGQEPSAGEVAALIDQIRDFGVHAILAEAQFPTTLADRIAEETGTIVVGDLRTDALSAPTDSYLEMMRDNAERIAEALAG